jgi:hypothetical protein
MEISSHGSEEVSCHLLYCETIVLQVVTDISQGTSDSQFTSVLKTKKLSTSKMLDDRNKAINNGMDTFEEWQTSDGPTRAGVDTTR